MALHRDGLYVGGVDGVLRLLHVSSPDVGVAVLSSRTIGVPIVTLAFDADFAQLAVGSPHAIHALDVGVDAAPPPTLTPICDDGAGDFVGVVSLAPDHAVVVSARVSGLLQAWDRQSGRFVGVISVAAGASGRGVACVAASPSIPAVVCGLSSGHLCVVDFSAPAHPRLVFEEKLHRGPLLCAAFDPTGVVLTTGAADGNVYVLSAAPSKRFGVLGFVAGVEGGVRHIALCKAPGLTPDTDRMKVSE